MYHMKVKRSILYQPASIRAFRKPQMRWGESLGLPIKESFSIDSSISNASSILLAIPSPSTDSNVKYKHLHHKDSQLLNWSTYLGWKTLVVYHGKKHSKLYHKTSVHLSKDAKCILKDEILNVTIRMQLMIKSWYVICLAFRQSDM